MTVAFRGGISTPRRGPALRGRPIATGRGAPTNPIATRPTATSATGETTPWTPSRDATSWPASIGPPPTTAGRMIHPSLSPCDPSHHHAHRAAPGPMRPAAIFSLQVVQRWGQVQVLRLLTLTVDQFMGAVQRPQRMWGALLAYASDLTGHASGTSAFSPRHSSTIHSSNQSSSKWAWSITMS